MANVEKMSISLPRDMVDDIRGAIDRGSYSTASEVLRDAMRVWKREQLAQQLPRVPKSIAELRRMVQEGIDSGPSLDADEVLARLKARFGGRNEPTKKSARKAGATSRKRSR